MPRAVRALMAKMLTVAHAEAVAGPGRAEAQHAFELEVFERHGRAARVEPRVQRQALRQFLFFDSNGNLVC